MSQPSKPLLTASPTVANVLAHRYEAVFRVMIIVALIAYGVYFWVFVTLDVPRMPGVNLVAIGICGLALKLLDTNRLNSALALMSLLVLGHSAIATKIFGWNADFHLFGLLVINFLLLCPYFSRALKLLIFVTLTASYVVLAFWFRVNPGTPAATPNAVAIFTITNMITLAGVLGFLAHAYASTVTTMTQGLQSLNSKLMQLATTDALTGLLNRRHMREMVELEIARFSRTARPFSIILADVDNFKAINDQFGHQAGDAALMAIAQAFQHSVRTQDQVARWGGEEFFVFLPETDRDEASAVARRVQERLLRVPITHQTHGIQARLTYGIAEYALQQSFDDLISAADRALYAGKAAGKDRIVAA